MAEWRWQFLENPAGWRMFVAVHEDKVVGQYVGVPLRMIVEGQERVFTQPLDSMVHPAHRAGLKRPGLFVKLGVTYFDTYQGRDRDLINYGLPIDEAFRVGKTFFHYEVVRQQTVLARELFAGESTLSSEVHEIARFDERARRLYDRCSAAWGASAIRDDAFWNWRFADHPRVRYRALGVSDEHGELRGVAIWSAGSWTGRPVGLICDWLVPPDDGAAAGMLVRALEALTREAGLPLLAGIFPEWSPWHLDFQERGYLVRPSGYFMNCCPLRGRIEAEWLRDNWWYQLADTDLC
jgi:hypothetical protein